MNADGSGAKTITSDVYPDDTPKVTSDGRSIIFISERPDHLEHIWRMDADGSNPRQLTTLEDYEVDLSPDGRWIIFSSYRKGVSNLWKMPSDGGEAVQFFEKLASAPVFSPDGKTISCNYRDDSVSPPRWRPGLVSFDDGKLIKTLDLPSTADRPYWSLDGREFLYVDTHGGVGNIWSQPVAGGPPRQVTRFNSEFINDFALTPDGKRFIVSRRTGSTEIILIRNFR